jgi:hypothetical protein
MGSRFPTRPLKHIALVAPVALVMMLPAVGLHLLPYLQPYPIPYPNPHTQPSSSLSVLLLPVLPVLLVLPPLLLLQQCS